jgi:hypothetical protein
MTLSIKTLSLSIKCHYAEVIMLGVAFLYFYVKCHYAECHYAECRYTECLYAECHDTFEEVIKNVYKNEQ